MDSGTHEERDSLPEPQGELESPFVEIDLSLAQIDGIPGASLSALEMETPFSTGLERGSMDLVEPVEPEKEFTAELQDGFTEGEVEEKFRDDEVLETDSAEERPDKFVDERIENEFLEEELENGLMDGLQAQFLDEELGEEFGEEVEKGFPGEGLGTAYVEEVTSEDEDLTAEWDEYPEEDGPRRDEAEWFEGVEAEAPGDALDLLEEGPAGEQAWTAQSEGGETSDTLPSDDDTSAQETMVWDEGPIAGLEGEQEQEEDEGEVAREPFEFEQAPAVPAAIAEHAVGLGREWSQRRNGSPTPEAMSAWLLRDYQDTVEGARRRFRGKYSIEAIGRAWLISREEHMRFQNDFPPGIRGLGDFRAPTGVRLIRSGLIKGSDKAPVAPLMVRFVEELRRRYPSSLSVSTYRGHGGGGFNDRGHSVDLFIEGRDNRGFYPPDEAVKFLQAVDATARAVNAEWRAIYNDFSVADRINRETGRHHVIFVGKVRKKNNRVTGLNWHGPHPLILHFHLDVAPGGGAPVAGVVAPSASPVTPAPSPAPRATEPPAELTRFVQRVLNTAERERLAVDGDFGPRTRGALERFREKYGLGAGGVLDDKTQLALAQRAIEEIRQQSLFGQLGVLDATTRTALATFKSERGLRADATLDTATRAALVDAL
jgi:hypothetical protein